MSERKDIDEELTDDLEVTDDEAEDVKGGSKKGHVFADLKQHHLKF